MKQIIFTLFAVFFIITGCCSSTKIDNLEARLEKMSDQQLAETIADKTSSIDTRATAHYFLGVRSLAKTDEQGAEARFLDSIKLFPEGQMALYSGYELGKLYETRITGKDEKKYLDKTITHYLELADRFKGLEKAGSSLFRAASLANTHRQFSKAIPIYEKLVKEYPRFPQLSSAVLAWINALTQTRNLQKASVVIEEYSEKFKGIASFKRQLTFAKASLLEKSGKTDEAKLCYKAIVANFPTTSEANLAAKILAGTKPPKK
jgi:TolA-binding protein